MSYYHQHQSQLVQVPQPAYHVTRAFTPLPSINFVENGSPGVNLGRALNNELQDLHHSDFTPVLTPNAKKVTLRINWPGYLPWCDVVHVFDHCYEAHPVTLAKLAHFIARKVQLCLNDLNTEMHRERAANPAWLVDGIDINDLELVRLEHVARGSWQPVLAYRDGRTVGRSAQ